MVLLLTLVGCAGDGSDELPRHFPKIVQERPDTGLGYTFERVERGTKLPLLALPIDEEALIDSGFGPRRMSLEEGRPDFHLGMDFDYAEGEPVLAIADGTVFRIHPSEDEDDANTLYIEHLLETPFDFHGEEVDRFYAVYSHLQGFDVSTEGDSVVAGQQIGRVGMTGGIEEAHLHLEIRIGTHCSLRYSVENPDSECAREYDPAVNPLHFIPGRSPEVMDIEIMSLDPLVIQVATKTTDQDMNRVVTEGGILDLDLRVGMDATTIGGLDQADLGWMLLTTELEHVDATHTRWRLEFRQNPGWVEILDIGGEGWRVELAE
jgi:hypothetical protein